jgi:hypothetical protein
MKRNTIVYSRTRQNRAARVHEAEVISELAMRSKACRGYSESFMEACRDELTVTAQALSSGDFHYLGAVCPCSR